MKVSQQCVVSLTWTLKDTLGEELDVLEEPVEFLVGGDDLLEKIDAALQDLEPGATVDLHLEPEDAFGDFDDQLLFLAPRDAFPKDLEEGMTFDGIALPRTACPDAPRDRFYTVTDIYPEHVVLDGNHPLSGIALRLHVRLEDVRQATDEELARRSAGSGFFKIQPPHGQQLH